MLRGAGFYEDRSPQLDPELVNVFQTLNRSDPELAESFREMIEECPNAIMKRGAADRFVGNTVRLHGWQSRPDMNRLHVTLGPFERGRYSVCNENIRVRRRNIRLGP